MLENGKTVSYSEGSYGFSSRPRGEVHGPQLGSTQRFTRDGYMLQYFDGPPSKLNKGETKKLTMD